MLQAEATQVKAHRQLGQFFKQLALLLRQGVPLLSALDVLQAHLSEQQPLREVVADVSRLLYQGQTLSFCLKQHPQTFPALAVALVSVGEKTGSLVSVLDRLGDWLERDAELRQRIAATLTYPLFVLGTVFVLLILMLWGVVPSLAAILKELDAPTPWPTALLLGVSGFLQHPAGLVAALGTLAASVWTVQQYLETPPGWRQFFYFARRLPLLGKLLEVETLVRYCDVLACALECGLDAVTAYRMGAEVSGNPLLMDDSASLVEAIRDGEMAGEYMAAYPDIYPGALVNLVRSGEDSGLLVRFMRVARDTFQLEVEMARSLLLATLEPLLITGVATSVGTLVLALLLPLQASLSKVLEG